MASIKDVAKLAGVSIMTASRVINLSGAVSAPTRARVQKAIKDLGYRPNLTARSLRAKRSHLLGLIVPDIENPVFAHLAKHVDEEAQRHGYNVMLGNSWEDPAHEAKALEIMLARQIDAVVLSPVSAENDRLIADFPIPLVVLDRSFRHQPPPTVTADNRAGGRLAARHLLDLGHRHFACVAGPLHIDVFADRLEGFRQELQQAGRDLGTVLTVESTVSTKPGAAAGRELFAASAARPLAVFCANDLTALGVIQAAYKAGLSVPGDVSVVGVDGIPMGKISLPPLTTVRLPFREMASAGVKLLVEMLRDRSQEGRSQVLEPELVERESTAPYRKTGKKRGK